MIRLTMREQTRVDAMNPQQRDRYICKKFFGFRASHPGKPRSYYQRLNVPKHLRSTARGINPGTV